MKFSVIIPLEYNRGLAVRCIQAWVEGQLYAGDGYELIVAAAKTHAPEEVDAIQRILRPHDRLTLFPVEHDMALVAAAAREARGDVFVFTESHCLPEADFLKKAAEVLSQHEEWAGFSGRSHAITHNLLSVIESELYERDISRNLTQHEWLKVLDQCFVIRRAEYWVSGGLEPVYGHFAEWLFAGRLFRRGFQIGYAPEVTVQHFYIGSLPELEAFTLDFTEGEMRFACHASADTCGDLFGIVPEWKDRARWKDALEEQVWALALFRFRWIQADFKALFIRKGWRGLQLLFRQFWAHGLRKMYPLSAALVCVQTVTTLQVWALRGLLLIGCKSGAKPLFQSWMKTVVHWGRLRWLSRHDQKSPEGVTTDLSLGGAWTPATANSWESLGFYEMETSENCPFRWTQPEGCLVLPLGRGLWKVTLHCPPFFAPNLSRAVRFFINGNPVHESNIILNTHSVEITVSQPSAQPLNLAWLTGRIHAPADPRHLGLPISRIEWCEPGHPMEPVKNSPITYFLHVPKCAGTTLSTLLDNHFPATECLSPYSDFYYAREIASRPNRQPMPPYVIGHFGWDITLLAPQDSWRILTLLREPRERLLSQFNYLKEHHRVSPDRGLGDWLENDLRASDLFLPYFVPTLAGSTLHGIQKLQAFMETHLEQAIHNLEKCEVVGLQENMEDTINLFCSSVGCYPPLEAPRLNVTLHRERWKDLPSSTQELLEQALAPEQTLYEVGVQLFHRQMDRLRKENGLTGDSEEGTCALRAMLRDQYFQRHSSELASKPTSSQIVWKPDDSHVGDNLHKREHHGGRSLRWTGSKPKTTFYLPVGSVPRAGSITIQLHPATPLSHAEAVQLDFNGQPVPLALRNEGDAYRLTGSIPAIENPVESRAWAELTLTTPVVQGAGEFRRLGVALEEFRLNF